MGGRIEMNQASSSKQSSQTIVCCFLCVQWELRQPQTRVAHLRKYTRMELFHSCLDSSNKCHASSNRCLTSSITMFAIRNKCLTTSNNKNFIKINSFPFGSH